jgi:hypothetical protein
MNKVVLVGALAAGGIYTLHNNYKDAAVDADTNQRDEAKQARMKEYEEEIQDLGSRRAARRKAGHFDYATNYIIALKRLLQALHDHLSAKASSSSLLQLPCLSTGKFASASTAMLAYAVLWGQGSALMMIEEG